MASNMRVRKVIWPKKAQRQVGICRQLSSCLANLILAQSFSQDLALSV